MDIHNPIPRRLSPPRLRGSERHQARAREGRVKAMFPRRATGRQVVAPPCRANLVWPFGEQDAMY